MTKSLQKISVVVLIFLLISCGIDTTLKTIKVEDKYQIDIPVTFIEQKELNKEASFLYGNPFSELYTIVFDESYTDMVDEELTLEDLYEVSVWELLDTYIENWEEMGLQVTYEDCKDMEINNLPAIFVEKKAVIDNTDILYNIAIIKGEKGIYEVYTWTTPSRKEKHQKTMNDILNSFKEL